MALLALDRVSKRYRRGLREVVALDEVSLELSAGEVVAVLGGARAGKTTLLRIAAGLEGADCGEVRFAGEPLSGMTRQARREVLRRRLGCVWAPDRSNRRLKVVDHVALPLIASGQRRRGALARAYESLHEVSAERCAEALLSELSRSEFVRVSLAQALIRGPELLLADESADTLDMRERSEVLQILHGAAARGVAVLLTTREASAVRGSTRCVSLSDGQLRSTRPRQAADVIELRGYRGEVGG
jgi:ABC-type ATPase involved in cell division